jgi:dihydroflavonol-4-reductase
MKSVLVTGANGHVGLNLTKELVKRGYKVRASVRNLKDESKVRYLKNLGVELVEADVMDLDSMIRAAKGVDGLFQLAAVYAIVTEDAKKDIIDPIVIGGLNVVKAAHANDVKKIIFTSSTMAVGSGSLHGNPLTEEDWNTGTKLPYAQAKTEAEKEVRKFADDHNMNLITICPSGIIGPGFYRHTPSTQLFEGLLRGKVLATAPMGFSFVDIRDVVKIHIAAYESKKAAGRYIVSNNYITFEDLFRIAKEVEPKVRLPLLKLPRFLLPTLPFLDWAGSRLLDYPWLVTSKFLKEFGGKEAHFSSERARYDFTWEPMDFRTTVADTLSWTRDHFFSKK